MKLNDKTRRSFSLTCIALTVLAVWSFASVWAAEDAATAWQNIKPGLHSGFGSVDVAYSKNLPPTEDLSDSIKLQGWKGERVHCQLLVWSPIAAENIRITANGFSNDQFNVKPEQVTISVVDYVLTDAFAGGIDRRDKTKFPVQLKPDRLSETNRFNLTENSTQPVWISLDIPRETPAGVYQGIIYQQSVSGTVNHRISLEVLNATLPAPSAWSFHLDLWQHPDSVARYGKVALWSPEHLRLLRPMLTLLAQAGQKCITTTLVEEPWNHQTFDDFGGMIKWTKRADGNWTYDYSRFDTYVTLAMECGITQQINCYSMVPVGNKISWHDEKSATSVTKELLPGTAEYEAVWRSFLTDFSAHLTQKGWLEKTAIALDERDEDEMKKLFGFLQTTAPGLKISVAGFYPSEVIHSIHDFSSNWNTVGQISAEVLAARKKAGQKTTFYVACNIPKPNTFTFSPPAEACYEGWFASALGFDGFLRWAYNSWSENPELDTRYIKWPSGDAFLVYPNAQSSIRFERLREGIQDYEKIRILREELVRNPSAEAVAAMAKLNEFMSSMNSKTLDHKSAAEVVNQGKQLLHQCAKSIYP